MSDTTLTRRSALRTGGLAAIMAGLLGTSTAAPASAQPARSLATVVHTDDLAAECRRLSAMLSPEQATLLRRFSDATSNGQTLCEEWQAAELARHLPGLAPAIRMVWTHTIGVAYQTPGGCCTVAAGFEP